MTYRSASGVLVATLLAGCAVSTGTFMQPHEVPLPPPPPPPGDLAPSTDTLKALYGEWRPVSGPDAGTGYVLFIWSPMFAWGSGCTISRGMLRDLGDGKFAVKKGSGGTPENCRDTKPIAPFTSGHIAMALVDDTLSVERGGETWVFRKVDVSTTILNADFIRGDWLLADRSGEPLRASDELTRVSFETGEYAVQGPSCSYRTNGWIADRDWQVCIGGRSATLVPAARFPELAPDAESIAPDPWALRLAEVGTRSFDGPARLDYALRAVGLGGEGLPSVEKPADPRRLAFTGLPAWAYERAVEAGLLPSGGEPPSSLRQHLASAPIVVHAALEGIVPVDRADGLALDYLYRVRESWRGNRKAGDLLIVRMPALTGKSRSPAITPEPREEVLLLASRKGYLAGRLIDGYPPSTDPRIVAMTLPLMRIVEGRLIEAIDGADVFGAAAFAGTETTLARDLARDVDRRMAELFSPGPTGVRRYHVTRVSERTFPDPTRLWITYDHDTDLGRPNGYGGVVSYFDGCTPVSFLREDGQTMAFANALACPGALPSGDPITEPAVGEAARRIDEGSFPYVICTQGPCSDDGEYVVPTPLGDVVLHAILR